MTTKNKFTSLANTRVLYVEDDMETRVELQSILNLYVAQLYSAKNGQEGLALYHEHRPDIVITDIQMPVMNGLSMAADIKSENPGQAIIILSAYNDVEYLFRALELEIRHYVTKPISVDRLLNKLVEIVEQMRFARAAEQNRRLLEQYKMLIDEHAIVAKIDINGKFSYVNQRFCDLSGFSEDQLLGKHYLFNCSEDNPKDFINDLKRVAPFQPKWQGTFKQKKQSGGIYVVDVSVIAVFDLNNQIEEFVALMTDVTDIHQKLEYLSAHLTPYLSEQKH